MNHLLSPLMSDRWLQLTPRTVMVTNGGSFHSSGGHCEIYHSLTGISVTVCVCIDRHWKAVTWSSVMGVLYHGGECYCWCHRGPSEFHYSLMKGKQYCVCHCVCVRVIEGRKVPGLNDAPWQKLNKWALKSLFSSLVVLLRVGSIFEVVSGMSKTLNNLPSHTHIQAARLAPVHTNLSFPVMPSFFTSTEPTHTSLTHPQ